MARTQTQQAIRDLNQRAARGELSAADAAAQVAAIYDKRQVALYRAALDVAAAGKGAATPSPARSASA